jgi:NADH-ubiquinone oxidoreductase chain 3
MNITLLVLIIFVPILALILLALNTLFAPHKAYEEKLSAYEAGMPPIPGQTRESFQIHFWLVAMLFLVFDIELVLLLPISVSLSQISTFGFVTAIIFFIVLTIGFIFEIGVGALSLKSENKNITPNQNKKDNYSLKNVLKIQTTLPFSAKNFRIQGATEQNDSVTEILNQVPNKDLVPNLSDLFINSPLEPNENSFIIALLDLLTNSMYLQYICLYFTTFSIVLFTCKIIIDKKIDLKFIKKFVCGKYIYFGITKYISFWRGSTNFWIYFALFFNFFFILISSVGTHRIIIYITKLFL